MAAVSSGGVSFVWPRLYTLTHRMDVDDFAAVVRAFPVTRCLQSGDFGAPDDDACSFCLKLYPNGCRAPFAGQLSVFVQMKRARPAADGSPLRRLCGMRFAIVSLEGNEFVGRNATRALSAIDEGTPVPAGVETNWGYRRFCLASDALAMLQSGRLILRCQLTVAVEHALVSSERRVDEPHVAALLDSVRDAAFADLTVVVRSGDTDARAFSLQRALLAAHSPVFRGAFDASGPQPRIDICGVQPRVFDLFLRTLYYGPDAVWAASDGDAEQLTQLLLFADKYLVTWLCDDCDARLAGLLQPGNLLAVLRDLAPLAAPCVRRRAATLLRRHWSDLETTDAWQQLVRDDAAAAIRLLSDSLHQLTDTSH